MVSNDELLSCSFCSKNQDEVKKLIAGPGVYICNECVDLCVDILHEEIEKVSTNDPEGKLPTPKELKQFLDQYVPGIGIPMAPSSVVYPRHTRARLLTSRPYARY